MKTDFVVLVSVATTSLAQDDVRVPAEMSKKPTTHSKFPLTPISLALEQWEIPFRVKFCATNERTSAAFGHRLVFPLTRH